MSDFPLLLTHGREAYWAAWAGFSLAGPIGAWLAARQRARAAARAGLDGPKGGILAETPPGQDVVLEGAIALEERGAGPRMLAQEAPRKGEARLAADRPEEVYLEVDQGGARIPIQGEIDLFSGAREDWGFRKGSGRLPTLSAIARRVPPGARVRVRGRLVPQPPEQEAARAPGSYRSEARRGFALRPARQGERVAVAAVRPRARLELGSALTMLFGAIVAFYALSWAGGRVAGGLAWDAGREGKGDLASAKRALRWAALGATIPAHRRWSLDAAGSALSIVQVKDPEAQRDFARLSARYERFRTGGCKQAIDWLARTSRQGVVAEIAEDCGDPASIREAARARIKLGEFEAASDLLARAAEASTEVASAEQVWLEVRANLLAGRPGRAAAALRQVQGRVGEFYERPQDPAALRLFLGCAADALSARGGDQGALARLREATFRPAGERGARGRCALLLADALEGSARLAFIDEVHKDRGIEPFRELRLLELEVDPSRADDRFASYFLSHPAWILAGKWGLDRADPLSLRALRRLSTVSEPTKPARRARLRLAAEQARQAAFLGAMDEALAFSELAMKDAETLSRDKDELLDADALVLQHAYIELRAGRPAPRALPPPSDKARLPSAPGWRRELEGVMAFSASGSLEGLAEPVEMGTFTREPGEFSIFAGLEIAGRGSGDALAAWLDPRIDSTALPVALLGAPRLTSGKEAMLDWLRRSPKFDAGRFAIGERAAADAMRARVAEILGDAALAAELRARSDRLRGGVLRRETGLVLSLLALD